MTGGVDTRTGAKTLALDELVRLAWAGQLRVPHFQRDFRWTQQDVIQLFDSILRGYPVGSLLLWERAAPEQDITLGSLQLRAPRLDHALWVVDGQQRVTSLANVLHPDGRRDPRFALGYDLRTRRIVPLPPQDDSFIIPLSKVFDLTEVLTWFAERPEVADYRQAAFDLARDLRQFAIPAYQVVQEDVHVLQDIFDRMNNSGKRLSRAEVFSALNAGTEHEAEERATLETISTATDSRFGFGRIDSDTVMQCILARRGPDIQREIRWEFDPQRRRGVVDFPEEGRDAAFIAAEESLARAVEFLRRVGVPHYSFLPYRYLIVVLTRFLALHPNLTPQQDRLLGRWFWRAALIGPGISKGSVTGAVRTLCARITAGSASRSLEELLAAVDTTTREVPDLRRFKTNEAATKIIACSWWDLGPRSPETAQPYVSRDLSDALVDRATPADVVRYVVPPRFVPTERRLWSSNRVLMPELDSETSYVLSLLEAPPVDIREGDWQTVLASHGIDTVAYQALRAHNAAQFMTNRQEILAGVLNRFLTQKCEWGFENTPELGELVIEDLTDGDDDL